MIVFFGPAGAGKSMQGQILAAREGWRWLSAGQILRDTHDPELIKTMHEGNLVPHEAITRIMGEAIAKAGDIDQIILDGFPRELPQAQWLIDSKTDHGRDIGLVVVLEVPREELLKRLKIRGRVDDTPEAIDHRLAIYRQEMYPILGLFTEQHIPVVHTDGVGTVGQVHDRIYAELQSRGLAS
ncbi:MAG TPA: nucleoside monophosphate kinase [Dongiaceae bacterium]|nr:nucleoside monophosphate kinase [Dongiaceae bacterium]